jgi:hypothetical protein
MRGQFATGGTYRGLATLLGSSLRTCQRWGTGRSTPSPDRYAQLAGHVYAHDPSLAAELAAVAGGTLESLGIVKPASLQAASLAHAALAARPEQLVENVIYAAAEAMDVSPRAIRGAVAAAFARAKELGIDVAAVDGVLAARPTKLRTK